MDGLQISIFGLNKMLWLRCAFCW